jgi:hypothetical protein
VFAGCLLYTFFWPSPSMTDLARTKQPENSQETMGIQTNIKLRGTVENTIYYQWRDIHCMRAVPAKVRQTKPTKKAAKDFGIAVKSSAVVRSLLRPLMPEPADRSIIYKTDDAFRKWLKENPPGNTEPVNEITYFNGLSFNDNSSIQKILQVKVTIGRGMEGSLLLQWPAFNPVTAIKAPAGTSQVVVQYIAATLNMKQPGQPQCAAANFIIPYADEVLPAKEILFENITGARNLVLVGMAIRYYKDDRQNKPINIMRWKPAGVVGSFYN